MSHTTLGSYYITTFTFKQHHGYLIEELDNMVPFERTIYVDFLMDFLKKKKEAAEG